MPRGWVRAWAEERRRERAGELRRGKERSKFRANFTTTLHREADGDSDALATLSWDDELELPDGIDGGDWTRVQVGGEDGFVLTEHVVELAWVSAGSGEDAYTAELEFHDGRKVDLLWGDPVQILRRDGGSCEVRARGLDGTIDSDRLVDEPLLEVYFIDVGQGDGVLVRLPSGRHLLIDGGLPRSNQMTGKNAADFVDWKFHEDYGDFAIRLDSLMASHCDSDHYGGLWDLVRIDPSEDDELDCVDVQIAEFHHAGLSRWEPRAGDPPHKDGLGPNEDNDWFVRLLDDRADAEAAVVDGAQEELAGWWKWFIEDILDRNEDARVTRLGVARETLQDGGTLPRLWPDQTEVEISVLAPVTVVRDGRPALKDLGDRGKNTNGHSICLRLDHGNARILLTGDLNKDSMDWLIDSYGDRIAAFECDVVKACHHGSADISYRFLEHVKAAATMISSGDAEGHAHPRPEVVAASAVSGHVSVDHDEDRLLTPLIYMTEIERSVSLGEVTHIRFRAHPVSHEGGEDEPADDTNGSGIDQTIDGALFGMPFRDIPDKAFPTRDDRREMALASDDDADQIEDDAIDREKEALEELDERQRAVRTRGDYHYRKVHELFSLRYDTRSVWRSRIMTRNQYGLVNVRTDGKTIMCATMREEGGGWTVHTFPARFGT